MIKYEQGINNKKDRSLNKSKILRSAFIYMPIKRRIDMNKNEDIMIKYNEKKQYVEMTCQEFANCLADYFSFKGRKLTLYNQVKAEYDNIKKKNKMEIVSYDPGEIYYHLPVDSYDIYGNNAFNKRTQDIYQNCYLLEIYLIMHVIGLNDPFYIEFMDEKKQKIYNTLLNGIGFDLWTRIRLYFDAENIQMKEVKNKFDLSHMQLRSLLNFGKKSLMYYELFLYKLGAKLTCHVPEELLSGQSELICKDRPRFTKKDTINNFNRSQKGDLSLDNMKRIFDYAYQLAKEKDKKTDTMDTTDIK